MNCYVHIGTEKTGTTSIQGFLKKNRHALASQGYYFPQSTGVSNSRKLAVAAYDPGRRDDFTRRNQLWTDDRLSAYQEVVIRDLQNEIAKISYDNVIFSCEQIQSRLTSVKEIRKLKDILVDVGADTIFIVVYLRDPTAIAGSNYSTWIRCGATDSEPPGPQHPKYKTLCDHRATLQKFEDVFGRSAIIPRRYDRSSFINESLVCDFLDAIACAAGDGFIMPEPLNEGISPLGLELLRRVNTRIPVFVEDKPNKLRQNIVSYFDRYFSGQGKESYVMPAGLFHDYQEAFAESNEWVRARWFPERDVLFENDNPRQGSRVQISSVDLDDIANMIADIWIEKNQELAAAVTGESLKDVATKIPRKFLSKFCGLFERT